MGEKEREGERWEEERKERGRERGSGGAEKLGVGPVVAHSPSMQEAMASFPRVVR